MVTIDNQLVKGKVVKLAETPHSYTMETSSGEVQRNHSQLNAYPEQFTTVKPEIGSSPTSASEQSHRIVTHL